MSGTTPERRKQPRSEQPTLEEVRACFHRLWSSQVGTKEYNKRDWQELAKMLFRKGLPV